jgi:hypothetical protein
VRQNHSTARFSAENTPKTAKTALFNRSTATAA